MPVSRYMRKEFCLETDWSVQWLRGGYRLVSCLLASSRIVVSSMAFGLDVFLSFIWTFCRVTLYIWNRSRVSINFSLVVVWRTSIMLYIGPMEWLFFNKWWADRDLWLACLKSRKCSENLVRSDCQFVPHTSFCNRDMWVGIRRCRRNYFVWG